MTAATPDLSRISAHRRVRMVHRLLQKWATAPLPPGHGLSPEQQLWLNVICNAVDDFLIPDSSLGSYSPQHYFNTEFPFAMHAQFVNLEPIAVVELLHQLGFLIEPNTLARAEVW